MQLDVNERLFLLTLKKLLNERSEPLCPLAEYEAASRLETPFFVETLRKLEKKKAVEIGFAGKPSIVKVANWYTRYPEVKTFFIRLTREGAAQV
jgi:hypothetical protein